MPQLGFEGHASQGPLEGLPALGKLAAASGEIIQVSPDVSRGLSSGGVALIGNETRIDPPSLAWDDRFAADNMEAPNYS